MVDATQFLLVFVIVIITIMLSVISVQVFFILKEFRSILQKVNSAADNVGKPISLITSLLTKNVRKE